jgi:hypothetical protein
MKRKKIEKLVHETVTEELEKRLGKTQSANAQQAHAEEANAPNDYQAMPPDSGRPPELRSELLEDLGRESRGAE